MASNDGSVAETERCPPFSCKEGPVLNMMSKRLRALKKKYTKILQIEESKAQGKTINKEQEEVLKTKIGVATLIDEYEKLRQPLSVAVKEELAEREKELMAAALRRADDEQESEEMDTKELEVSHDKSQHEVRKELEPQGTAVCSDENLARELIPDSAASKAARGYQHYTDGSIADLLTFLYFAQLFDVRSYGENSSLLWTKAHERSSCLSYDCVTEDETSPLLETDLDDLALFGLLLTSRPPNATLSHSNALQHCIEHAKQWLQNSDAPIREDLDITYSHLRERLTRILSSEYFTMIPELQTVIQQSAVAAASASSQYTSQLLIHEVATDKDGISASDETPVYFSPQEQTCLQPPYQIGELYFAQPLPASSSTGAISLPETSPEDTSLKVDSGALPKDDENSLRIGEHKQSDLSDSLQKEDSQEQEGQHKQLSPIPNASVGPRGYAGAKGGGRGYNHGTGGRGRGYANGRGGRNGGGRGGFGNGWGGQYYDQGGYHPRNYNGRGGGGRNMRGGNSTYSNGYVNGQAARATSNMPT